jgi:bifunctional non-homologous end joining protein LigD
MQPTGVDAPFDDPAYLFEPWWPGVRALALVERGRVRLQVAGLADAEAAFPELAELAGQLAEDGVVVDGTLLVLDDGGRPDSGLLRARLDGRLPRPGRAAYVAGDLLWAGGEPVTRRAFAVRRAWLEAILAPGDRIMVGHGYARDGTLVAEALGRLGMESLSARRLSARYRSGAAGDAWLRAPIFGAPAPSRPTLALIQRLPLVVPDPQ